MHEWTIYSTERTKYVRNVKKVLNVYTNLQMYILFRNFVLRKMKLNQLKTTTMNKFNAKTMYKLTTTNYTTGEVISTEIFNHWPCREAWNKELKDYNIKCKIEKL